MKKHAMLLILLLVCVVAPAQNTDREKQQSIKWLEKHLKKNYNKALSFQWDRVDVNDSILTFIAAQYHSKRCKCAPEKQTTWQFRIDCLAQNEMKQLIYYVDYDPKKMSKFRRNFHGLGRAFGKTARKKEYCYGIELPPECQGIEEILYPYTNNDNKTDSVALFYFFTENKKQAQKIQQKINFLFSLSQILD